MNQGMKRSSTNFRHLALFALALALPASSMTSNAEVEPDAPSVAQRALIEVHDTAGVGWWSSSPLEIGPAPPGIRTTDRPSGQPVSAPGGVRRNPPGAETF
jgi:hypothetical protein